MKIFNISIVSLFVIATALGWHNHRQLTNLRVIQGELAAQAAARGISPDPEPPGLSVRITKRARPDRIAGARQSAAEFITYAQEMASLGWKPGGPEKATKERMMDQMDRMMSLDSAQLKIVIAELWAAKDIDIDIQKNLINFSIERLAKDHPEAALEILVDTPGLLDRIYRQLDGSVENVAISNLFQSFAKINHEFAIGWFQKNKDKIPADMVSSVESGLVRGTQDARTALRLVVDFGKDPKVFVPFLFERILNNPEERTASLAVLREWSNTILDEKTREELTTKALQNIVLGKSNKVSFSATTSWIDKAELSPKEIDQIAAGLDGHVKPEETVKWSEWLEKSLPPEVAKDRMRVLFEEWIGHDYERAGQWLASAPDGSIKTSAILAYVQATVRADPDTAVKWLMTLPPSEDRNNAGWRVYADWPKKDAASWEAADAFAKDLKLK